MEQKLIENLKEIFEMNEKEILRGDNFREYENWSSLSNIALIAMLDSEFGVYIESNAFNKLKTVGDLLGEVERRM